MQFDRRFLVIVACSLAWGLIVAAGFYRVTSASRGGPPEKSLVVAARPLAPGAAIEADAIKTVRVPERAFPKGGYGRAEDVVGRPVISSIGPDEPVVEGRLAARGSGFGVAPMIPAGMRAASVRVNDVAGVAGFVLPGMRVDVLVTGRTPAGGDTFTATVLQNVTVLSAGQTVETDGKSQSMSVPVVTLLVTPEQAESLTLAASEGHIQLALRNSSDQKVEATAGREWRDLYAGPGGAPARAESLPTLPLRMPRVAMASAPPRPEPPRTAAPAPQPAAAPAHPPAAEFQTVILIRGSQKTVETFPAEARGADGAK